jgi:hypothetical protein
MATASAKIILSSWCDIPFNQLVISRRASAGSGELPELLYSFVRMLAAVAEPTETERLVIANSRKRRKTAAKRLWLTPSGCSKDEPATAE